MKKQFLTSIHSKGERFYKKVEIAVLRAFGSTLSQDLEEAFWWQEMRYRVATCLRDHRMYAACVTGEASIELYQYYIYNFIHRLVDKLQLDPQKEAPRLHVVAGPILNVSESTSRSIAVELWREGLIRLYASRYRQPEHYRAGGWNGKTETGEKMLLDIYREESHSPLAPATKRIFRFFDEKNPADAQAIDKYKKHLFHLLKRTEEITSESMLAEKFIFLNCKEHHKLTKGIIDFYKNDPRTTPEQAEAFAFSAPIAEELSLNFLKGLTEKLQIRRRQYPEKRATKAKTNISINGLSPVIA